MALLKVLVYAFSALVIFPTILVPFLVQNQQGKELGRVATCLCCLDFNIPDLGGWSLILMVALIIACFMLIGWSESSVVTQRKKALEEMKQKWGWHVGKRVAFDLYGMKAEGIVMDQSEDDLYINYLHNAGCISQTVRKIGEVTAV